MAPSFTLDKNIDMRIQTAYRQEVFRQYNRARHATEVGRCNRALGLLMKPELLKAKIMQYGTTYVGCNCPDSISRNVLCKHRIAFVINWRAIQHLQELIDDNLVELEFEDDRLVY